MGGSIGKSQVPLGRAVLLMRQSEAVRTAPVEVVKNRFTIRIASIERLPEEATRAFGYLAAPLAIMKYGYVWAAS